MTIKASALAFFSLLLAASPALAAGDAAKPADAPAADADQKPADKDAKPADAKPAEDPYDPFEDPLKSYRFIGLRFRDAIVPKFMINIFAAGGRTVNVPMVGPEFTQRRDHLEYDIAIQYAPYTMPPTLLKGKNEPDTAYELVQSSLKQVFFTIDLMYEVPLETKGDKTGRFSLLFGGGVGLGVVFGNLYRSQAYPLKNGASPDDPSQWGACKGAGNPNGSYCDSSNTHFSPTTNYNNISQGYSESSWANGGSKPLLFPWLALPQISFRYKPIKQLQTRLDTGFSTSGFFFGLSAGYGL